MNILVPQLIPGEPHGSLAPMLRRRPDSELLRHGHLDATRCRSSSAAAATRHREARERAASRPRDMDGHGERRADEMARVGDSPRFIGFYRVDNH